MKALITGGGIGGPAVAVALREVGIDAEIYEAYGAGAEGIGAFLNVASNGMAALRVLGLHQEVARAGIPTPDMVMWNGAGKRLGRVPNGMALDDGTVSHTILRSDLYRILRDAAAVPISYGKRMVSFDDSGSQVVARFEDGTSAAGDVLIAADGVHSRARRLLGGPEARYVGLYNCGGIVKDPDITGEPGVYHMVFGKRAFFGYTVTGDGETWWFANLPRGLGDEPADWRPVLEEAFADDAGIAAGLVRHADLGRVLPIHDLPPVPTWHRGRVVLIGDAAHATSPSSGQGASLALEDAVVLARCLRDAPSHREAFRRYESERRERAERVVAYARRISDSKAAGPVGRIVRDALLPIILRRQASRESLAWMYRHEVSL